MLRGITFARKRKVRCEFASCATVLKWPWLVLCGLLGVSGYCRIYNNYCKLLLKSSVKSSEKGSDSREREREGESERRGKDLTFLLLRVCISSVSADIPSFYFKQFIAKENKITFLCQKDFAGQFL